MVYTASTVLLMNEHLSGPEEWLNERDKELDSLCDRLYVAKKPVDEFISKLHGRQQRIDSSSVLNHVKTVAKVSENLATAYFSDMELPNEIRYNVRVCYYSALLHEALPFSGLVYESISFMTDKSVADAVCAITPMANEPFSIRLEHLVNRVNRCGPSSQIVKLADLIHDGIMYDQLVDAGGIVGLFDSVQRFVVELEMFHRSFTDISKNPQINSLINKFPALIDKLYNYMKRVDSANAKKSSKTRKRVV